MAIIPVLEVLLFACGAISVVGTCWSMWRAHQEHILLEMSGINGLKRQVSIANIIRQGCRLLASLATATGGLHLIFLPDGQMNAMMTAKITLTVNAMALTGTIAVDIWTHRKVAR